MKHENAFARHGLFDAHVPRYTSYPPANRFVPLESGAVAQDWQAQIPHDTALSFYMHVPFCRRLCWFCACRTQGTKTAGPVDAYTDQLIREINQTALGLNGARASRIHIGGGTPTLLSPRTLARLMAAFDTQFERTETCEFSVEIDPTEFDLPRAEALAGVGMNRASLGVQDFDPRVQDAIGRQQSVAQTRDCITALRARGVDNFNLDILYGLPFQTLDTLDRTLDQVLDLAPDRIAAFGYAHVPWMSRRQALIPSDELPEPRERLALFERIAHRLATAGYIRIGIDHFALPNDGLASALAEGRLHRNFQGYTDDNSPWLIGMGASAISKYPQGYLHNATSTADYLHRIKSGAPTVARGVAMTDAQNLTAAMIEALMCYGRIDLDRLAEKTGLETRDGLARLTHIAEDFSDFASLTGNALHVHKDGYPLLRIMAAKLDDADIAAGAHAIAV